MWDRTQCLACGELSPHADWYHDTRGSPESLPETRDVGVSA